MKDRFLQKKESILLRKDKSSKGDWDEKIKGLCDYAGWDAERAEDHFMQNSSLFEIENEIHFILNETQRLSHSYPKVKVAPLLYKVEDNLLYWIDSNHQNL